MNALRRDINAKVVTMKDFMLAMQKVQPSLTPELIKFYEEMGEFFKKKSLMIHRKRDIIEAAETT